MLRICVIALFTVAAAVPAASQALAKRIDSILRSNPQLEQAFIGIHVVDTASGQVVLSRNADRLFVPASNTKLFSTAAALQLLGPDHQFRTRLVADRVPASRGTVGELRIIGSGDPNISARVLPYKKGGTKPNALEVIDSFADAVIARGISRVDGDIVGDDSIYLWEPYASGWTIDDAPWEYGAPVSALTLNDSAFHIQAAPGETEGSPAVLTLTPAFEHLVIHNQTRTVTGKQADLDYSRAPFSHEIVVTGTIGLEGSDSSWLAVDDPALFAAAALRDALISRGVEVTGGARAVHRTSLEQRIPQPAFEVATHTSLPLIEALRVVNKESQNLHAELLVREIGRAAKGIGSRRSGLEQIAKLIESWGIKEGDVFLQDGSGLSRMTLISPKALTTLLLKMYGSPLREQWVDTLPIGGVDGTLAARFDRKPQPGVRAKTGTIRHVSGLSGYLMKKNGRTYAFSIMANNYNLPHAQVRSIVDRIVLALLK